MKLDLTGAVLILDEAHNIEECCREAAGCTISFLDMESAMKDCKRVAELGALPDVHNQMV